MSAPALPPGALPPVPPGFEDIIGPQLIGALFNYTLWGVLAVQFYVYHLSFPYDNPKIKALVYFVVAFETAQTIMNGVDTFNKFARGFGNVLIISDPGLGTVYTPIMGAFMALTVQIFFCYRIWLISKLWWLASGISLVSLLQAVCGLAGGIRSTIYVDDVNQSHSFGQEALVHIWLIGDAVTDILIAAAMSFFLMRGRSTSSSRSIQTNDVLYRIVRMTVETNALSAAIALISVILYKSLPNTTYFTCPTLIIGKLYVNTLLLTFNNRAFLGKGMSTHVASSGSATLPSYHSQSNGERILPFRAGLNPDDIFLTETDTIDIGANREGLTKRSSGGDSQMESNGTQLTKGISATTWR